jgi:hypothetical protein
LIRPVLPAWFGCVAKAAYDERDSRALLDPAFHTAFRDRFLFSRRAALGGILQRAVDRGEFPTDTDLELIIDIVFGVLWYRLMLDHLPLNQRLAQELTTLIMKALQTS